MPWSPQGRAAPQRVGARHRRLAANGALLWVVAGGAASAEEGGAGATTFGMLATTPVGILAFGNPWTVTAMIVVTLLLGVACLRMAWRGRPAASRPRDDLPPEQIEAQRLRLLDAAVTQLRDGVMITEASTTPPGPRIVFVNEAFVAMTGHTRAEALGATPDLLCGPDTDPARLRAIRAAIAAPTPLRTELTHYRRDGTPFTVELDTRPVVDATGACSHVVWVQRDTTLRRAEQDRQRAREEGFRLASRASRDIFWDWDLRTGLLRTGESARQIGGCDGTGTPQVAPLLEGVHPEDRDRITESLGPALGGEARTWSGEYRVRAQDGAWRTLADTAFILRDADGRPRRMVGARTDVTDLRRLDAQLHQAQKLESVGQLTGGIAHDFNNLLTIILGNCDILLDDMEVDSALRPLIRSIEEAAERGARVSTALLAYARRQSLEARPSDINELVRRSSSLFARAVDACVDIRYDLACGPTLALVDPDKLQAALLNLVINAKAVIVQEGCITIRTRAAQGPGGSYVAIDVTDTGTGMAPEVAARAFEPFFTTKAPGAGTGLGLSSVDGFVKQSGGQTRLVSRPGTGTTVTLCLPVAAETHSVAPAEPAAPPLRRGRHRILVVEDDANFRAFVRHALGRMGYRVVEAESGAAALRVLEGDAAFDLLFTDVVMPGGVNGLQLAQQACALAPGMRVLATSGYPRDSLPIDSHLPGDIPMLHKPFRMIELAERIHEALSGAPTPDRQAPARRQAGARD